MHSQPSAWNRRIWLRYALFQIPGGLILILALWWAHSRFSLPLWLAALVVALWIVKDLALYPVLWRAYAVGDRQPGAGLIGMTGETESELSPAGFIRVKGEIWRAQASSSAVIPTREKVRVVNQEGMTLIVEPLDLEL